MPRYGTNLKNGWREKIPMDEKLKIEQLFTEKALAEALMVSRSSLRKLRGQGCPWVSLFGKAYFHGILFMEWVLKNRLRASDQAQDDAKQHSQGTK